MMIKRMIAWVTVVSVLLVWGIVGDIVDIFGTTLDLLTVSAEAEGDFEIDGNGVLTKYNGSDAVVVIPEGVTSISNYAFSGCQNISEIELPDGVTSVGSSSSQNAFTSPNSATPIPALIHCNYDSDAARAVSRAGRSFYVPDDTSYQMRYMDVDGMPTCSLKAYTGTDSDVKLPDYVEYLPHYALNGASFESIDIPESVFVIGRYVLYNCKALKDVYLPRSMEEIDDYAFYGVSKDVKFHVFSGSEAEAFVAEHGYSYVYRDASLRVNVDYAGEGLSVRVTGEGGTEMLRDVVESVSLFRSVAIDSAYTVELVNNYGAVLAKRENVVAQGGVNEITFTGIKDLGGVRAVVRDAETRENLTSKTAIHWLDEEGQPYAEGDILEGVPVGTVLTCEVCLDDTLLGSYVEIDPIPYTIVVDGKYLSIPLSKYETRTIQGKVSAPELPSVTVRQQSSISSSNIEHSFEANADGSFTLEVPALDATLEIAAKGCTSRTVNAPNGMDNVGTVALQPIEGARVTVNATVTRAVAENGQNDPVPLDLTTATVTVNNQTTAKPLGDVIVMPDGVILPTGVSAGDVLTIEVSGEDIARGEAVATLGSDRTASTELSLIEKGYAVIAINQAPASATRLLVYDNSGTLIDAPEFEGKEIATPHLDAGSYTFALMQTSTFVDAPQTMDSLENIAHAQVAATVSDGAIAYYNVDAVPALDESTYYATDPGKMVFRSSRDTSQVGRTFSITACAPLSKGAEASDFRWVFEISGNNAYMDNTLSTDNVMRYDAEIADGRIVLEVEDPAQKVRFCVMPLEAGNHTVQGYLEYVQNGQAKRQSLGTVTVTVETPEIYVEGMTYEPKVYVYGKAPVSADVAVYDGDALVAETTTGENGSWGIWVNLNKPGTYSTHYISAVYTLVSGYTVATESTRVVYQYMEDPVVLSRVLMYTYGHDFGADGVTPNWDYEGTVTFDFENPDVTTPSYGFYPMYPLCHFLVQFKGDTSKVSRVKVNVICSDGSVRTLRTEYSEEYGGWYVKDKFSANCMPAGVTVHYVNGAEATIEDSYENVFEIKELNEDENYMLPIELDKLGPVDEEIAVLVDEYNQIGYSLREQIECFFSDYLEVLIKLNSNSGGQQYWTIQDDVSMSADDLLSRGFESMKTTSGYRIYYSYDFDTDILEFYNETKKQYIIEDYNVLEKQFEGVDIDGVDKRLRNESADIIEGYLKMANIANRLLDLANEQTTINTANRDSGIVLLMNREAENDQMNAEYLKSRLGFFANAPVLPDKGIIDALRANRDSDDGRSSELKKLAEEYPDCSNLSKAMEADDRAWDSAMRVYRHNLKKAGVVLEIVGTIGGIIAGFAAAPIAAGVFGGIAIAGMIASYISDEWKFKNPIDWDEVRRQSNAYSEPIPAGAEIVGWTDDGKPIYTIYENSNTEREIFNKISEDFYNKSIANDPEAAMRSSSEGNGSCPVPPLVNPPKPTTPILDPSGYVYEAVESNRIEGATATAIQRVTLYDMYDEPYTEDQVWDALPFEQTNPQQTNANGEFAWDVPDGLWQIQVSKSGYEDAQTDWMVVPPERKDVHISLVSLARPFVKSVKQTEDGLVVTFEKYVFMNQLNGKLTLTVDGQPVAVTLTGLNVENNPAGQALVSKVRVVPAQDVNIAETIVLTVSGSITSYAGVAIGEDMSYEMKGVTATLSAPENLTLLKGATADITVVTTPEGYFEGKALTVVTEGDSLTAVNSDPVGANGKAVVHLTALEGGAATITFTVEGTNKSAQTQVTCIDPEDYNVLKLPSDLKEVKRESFFFTGPQMIILPEGCESVGENAFADCENLLYILVPAGKYIEIADNAFDRDKVTVLEY